jgi:outer membrane protein OmpA-like peptidoglycan-associated protein
MMYKRKYAAGYIEPNNKDRLSFLFPVGVGFEAFMSKKVSFTADAGYSLVGDEIDLRKNSSLDGFLTANVGLKFYFGGGDDGDNDKDGLTNGEERRLGTNPDVPDTDGDGLKDGEEVKRYKTNPLKPDTDGDGLTDGEEVFKYKTNPLNPDTDGDGLSDGDEVLKYQTDPLKADTDGDGLSDGDEVLRHHTNPLKVDTDDDGLSDWQEFKIYHSDPTNPDTDGDGLTDGEEILRYKTNPLKADTDGGGANDGDEVKRGTNPLNPMDDGVQGKMILEKGATLVLEGVTFNSGSAVVTPASERILEQAFAALSANPDILVEIAGYTDNTVSPGANVRISRLRAESVRQWLVNRGISATRMTAVGQGMRNPIAPNTTAEGRARNRRIEFHILK